MQKIELLAPAGDLERLKFALLYGADAVYVGGTMFGLRANASNFTLEELEEAVCFAHERNKKVYVTVNIALHTSELKQLTDYLCQLDKIGIDAIIISDPAIIPIARENTDLEIHLSTQQSTLNYEAVEFWKKQGITRIVLGRETSREEIKEIKEHVDIEIECFIHGAMCSSISGRCAMSNFLTGRDANRGGCAQTCRWDFGLENRNGDIIKGEKDFTFCAKDLSMLKSLPEMIDMGIKSFKIEGRMRSIYYIATIVGTYRKAIDRYLHDKENYKYDESLEQTLRNCANRDAVIQFFYGLKDETCSYYNGREEISNQEFLGIVLDYDKETNVATIEQRNYFKKGDTCTIFGSNHGDITYTFTDIIDEDDNIIDVVRHPRQIVKIKINEPLEKYDMLRIKKVDKTPNV